MDSELTVKEMQAALANVPGSVLQHVIDVHCHPTDSDMGATLQVVEEMHIRICAMATRRSDQRLVADLARAQPEKVIPCFGWYRSRCSWQSLQDIMLDRVAATASLSVCSSSSVRVNNNHLQATIPGSRTGSRSSLSPRRRSTTVPSSFHPRHRRNRIQ